MNAVRYSTRALLAVAAALCVAGATSLHAQSAPPADETPFLTENNAAMDKMMADMNAKPTGDGKAYWAEQQANASEPRGSGRRSRGADSGGGSNDNG